MPTPHPDAARRFASFTRRPLLAVLLVAVHLAVLVIVVQRPGSPEKTPIRAMTVVAVAAPAPAPAPVSVAPPASPPPKPIAIEAPRFEMAPPPAATPPQALPPGGCAMTTYIEAALAQQPAVARAAAAVPRAARTVANVVTLWNAGWADPRALGGDPVLAPIRQAISAAVRSAPAACQAETMMGPRLVLVTEAPADTGGDSTLVLAFGSGQWRWDELIE